MSPRAATLTLSALHADDELIEQFEGAFRTQFPAGQIPAATLATGEPGCVGTMCPRPTHQVDHAA